MVHYVSSHLIAQASSRTILTRVGSFVPLPLRLHCARLLSRASSSQLALIARGLLNSNLNSNIVVMVGLGALPALYDHAKKRSDRNKSRLLNPTSGITTTNATSASHSQDSSQSKMPPFTLLAYLSVAVCLELLFCYWCFHACKALAAKHRTRSNKNVDQSESSTFLRADDDDATAAIATMDDELAPPTALGCLPVSYVQLQVPSSAGLMVTDGPDGSAKLHDANEAVGEEEVGPQVEYAMGQVDEAAEEANGADANGADANEAEASEVDANDVDAGLEEADEADEAAKVEEADGAVEAAADADAEEAMAEEPHADMDATDQAGEDAADKEETETEEPAMEKTKVEEAKVEGVDLAVGANANEGAYAAHALSLSVMDAEVQRQTAAEEVPTSPAEARRLWLTRDRQSMNELTKRTGASARRSFLCAGGTSIAVAPSGLGGTADESKDTPGNLLADNSQSEHEGGEGVDWAESTQRTLDASGHESDADGRVQHLDEASAPAAVAAFARRVSLDWLQMEESKGPYGLDKGDWIGSPERPLAPPAITPTGSKRRLSLSPSRSASFGARRRSAAALTAVRLSFARRRSRLSFARHRSNRKLGGASSPAKVHGAEGSVLDENAAGTGAPSPGRSPSRRISEAPRQASMALWRVVARARRRSSGRAPLAPAPDPERDVAVKVDFRSPAVAPVGTLVHAASPTTETFTTNGRTNSIFSDEGMSPSSPEAARRVLLRVPAGNDPQRVRLSQQASF